MNRRCFTCENNMNEVITSIKAGWGKYELTIDGIKAFQCSKCGHTTYIIVLQQQTKKTSFLNAKPLQYSYTNGFRGSFSPEFLF